jgi:hypothetical protein
VQVKLALNKKQATRNNKGYRYGAIDRLPGLKDSRAGSANGCRAGSMGEKDLGRISRRLLIAKRERCWIKRTK